MMDKLLLLAAVLFNCYIQHTVGQYPIWSRKRSGCVAWQMDDRLNKYTVNINQCFSASQNKVRWDINGGPSHIIWSLNDEKLDYVFPTSTDGQIKVVKTVIRRPFPNVTEQSENNAFSIIYPNMRGFMFMGMQNGVEVWQKVALDPMKGQAICTVQLTRDHRYEPVILSVTHGNNYGNFFVTNYDDYYYGEPNPILWLADDVHVYQEKNGTGENFEESLVHNFMRGISTIWPKDQQRGIVRSAVLSANEVSLRTQVSTQQKPFPYSEKEFNSFKYPKTLNWLKCGAVTRVKDQDICSGCASFAAVGVLETLNAIYTNKLEELSEQAAKDCAWSGRGFARRNAGCFTGYPDATFEWVAKMGGIPTTASYGSFIPMHDLCRVEKLNIDKRAPISSYSKIPPKVNAIKMALLRHGTVAAGFLFDQNFSEYRNGIIKGTTAMDKVIGGHASLIVGYDVTDTGETYWILKNSWGRIFGEEGYFFVLANETTNPMFILDDAWMAQMDHAKPINYCDICHAC